MTASTANLPNYVQFCATFSWGMARHELSGMGNGRLNIAYEALDRHMATETAERTAVRFLARDSETPEDISYRALNERANRFANVLQSLGVQPGERVYGLSHRIPDLYAAVLGTLKQGCVFTPLFPAFGPEPIRQRVEIGEPAVLVTNQRGQSQ